MTLSLKFKATKDNSWNIIHYVAGHQVGRTNVFKMWEWRRRLIEYKHLSIQSNKSGIVQDYEQAPSVGLQYTHLLTAWFTYLASRLKTCGQIRDLADHAHGV
jgi:hypothetical protein